MKARNEKKKPQKDTHAQTHAQTHPHAPAPDCTCTPPSPTLPTPPTPPFTPQVAFVLEYAHEGVSSTGFDGYTLATFQAAAEAISSLEIDVLFAVEGEGGGGEGGGGEGGGGDGGGGNGGCGDGGGDNDGGDDDGGSSDGGGGEGGVQATKIGE